MPEIVSTTFRRFSRSCPDLTGDRFGKLLVVGYAGRDARGSSVWTCLCDCGKLTNVVTGTLRCGLTRSCGCLLVERGKRLTYRHGLCKSTEYHAWSTMIARCHVTSAGKYEYYGARGITVCDQWRRDFVVFLSDVGRRPSKNHSLDRIDNNGNYEPGNVRWATKKEQARNKRTTNYLTVGDKTRPLIEWAEIVGVSVTTLRYRVNAGWPPEKVLTPARKLTKSTPGTP